MMDYTTLSFAYPWFLSILFIIPCMVFWYLKKIIPKKQAMKIPSLDGFSGIKNTVLARCIHLPFAFRCIATAMMILALARPQTNFSIQDITAEGIDIVLTMDLSPSMLAKDFSPNRLQAAKSVATDFIDGRKNDRIGLVVFSGEAYTQCPLTIDHSVLKNLLGIIEPNFLADGTAIGMGLGTAVNRLRESKSLSKVIILITDGENNAGSITPLTAAEIAKIYGIRVYTIGVGTKGVAYSPVSKVNGKFIFDYTEVRIDEPLLNNIADMTGGKYFRATDMEGLKDVYQQIDLMEKTRFISSEIKRKKEVFKSFAFIALFFLVSEIILSNSLLRSITDP